VGSDVPAGVALGAGRREGGDVAVELAVHPQRGRATGTPSPRRCAGHAWGRHGWAYAR